MLSVNGNEIGVKQIRSMQMIEPYRSRISTNTNSSVEFSLSVSPGAGKRNASDSKVLSSVRRAMEIPFATLIIRVEVINQLGQVITDASIGIDGGVARNRDALSDPNMSCPRERPDRKRDGIAIHSLRVVNLLHVFC